MKKIAIIKKKEVLLGLLALFFLGIGFFSYNPIVAKKSLEKVADIENYPEDNLGEATLVSSNNIETENILEENESVEKETEFFLEEKMKRDNTYSENLEVYEKILENSSISSDQKTIAQNEISNITNEKKSIDSAESLIKIKGFEDVVIFKSNNGVSVIVKSDVLLAEQVAQIQNIIEKEFQIDSQNITITNK